MVAALGGRPAEPLTAASHQIAPQSLILFPHSESFRNTGPFGQCLLSIAVRGGEGKIFLAKKAVPAEDQNVFLSAACVFLTSGEIR